MVDGIVYFATLKRRTYALDALTGKQVLGRLGGGGGYTVNTDDLMAEAGCLYHTSWIIDDQPLASLKEDRDAAVKAAAADALRAIVPARDDKSE